MRLLLLVAVTCTAILGPVASNSASGSGSSSSTDLPQDLPEYAFAPQLWTQTVPPTAAIGATLSLSKPLYKSSVNDSYQLQVLSAPDGSITTLLIATDPTTPAVVYGTGTLASFVPNVGEILTAGPGTTRTSVVIATTRAVFLFDTSFDFNNTFTPSIYLPSDPILAVSWAPTTGLYLVVQSQHLTWWNATADRTLGASLNVTTPLVGPVTAQCGMDGVCWIGDSLATFVVAYASSALIQTMAMRGQWPTDATMAPLIRPLSGRRAVMAWGVRVGLLTSQQAGNLGMNWSSTQTSDTTALGVFPALGQTGLVVTGHNVSVTVYDLASGSPIGSTGQLQAAQLRPSQQWTTIEVDTSAQPYLLLATGVNCAASWELVNATGAIATAAPAWSASDAVKGGFSTLSIPCVPAMGSAGATCWLLQMAYPGIGYLTAIVLSPQQQAVLGSFQNRRLGGVVVTTVVAQHTVVVVAGRQGLFAFDAAATPVLAPPPAAFLFASTLDAATSTVYVVGWLTLGQVGVFRVPQGATTPTLIAAWAVANTSYPRTANAEVLLALGGTRLIVSGTFLTSSPFTTPWFGAVIDLQTGVLLFKELMSAGVVGTIVDSVNSNLIFITQTSYNVVAWSTGTVSALPLTFNITGFTRIAQTGNRVLLRGFRGFWVVNSLTAALMFSRAATRVYPAFSNDGGIVECVYDEATSASKLNQYSFNFDLFRSVEVPCTSAPLQTPDGSVYVGVQGPSDPLSSYQSTYLARANFSNASLTPAVELWREVGAAVGQMIYNPTHQLMVYWAPSFGWQACVDLVRGVTLWNNTVDANYGNVDAAQGLVAGATNVLWADPAQFGTTKKAINLFTGDIIESIVSDAQTDMTYVTSQVVGGVARPIVIVVQFEGVATWTNLAVTDVSLPSDFRSSTLPLFTTPLLPLRLPANKLATPSTGSSGLAGELLGAAAGVALVAGAAALFLRFRRRRTAEDGSTYQDLPSVALPAVSDV